jgi:hypothetical protein
MISDADLKVIWKNFIIKLDNDAGFRNVSFLGAINKYEKVFLDANGKKS